MILRPPGSTLPATLFPYPPLSRSGGVPLQWPLGRLSDRYDRRFVIVGGFALTLGVSIALAMQPTGALLLALGFAFGGLSFALYPLSVAHANDRLLPSERVTASGQLVLLYSAGAAPGPRSDARRLGKECGRTCRSRGAP